MSVTTAELERGIEIRFDDTAAPLASGTTSPPPGGFLLSTALCKGVTLYVGPRNIATYMAVFHLDDG